MRPVILAYRSRLVIAPERSVAAQRKLRHTATLRGVKAEAGEIGYWGCRLVGTSAGVGLLGHQPMQTAFTVRTTVLGLASWAIPFAISFLFFDQSGHLVVAQPLFKSIMVLVGGGSGAALLLFAFPKLSSLPMSALALGVYWSAINVALDLATLVALMHMPIMLYLSDIGLRYLMLPIIASAMGVVAARVDRARESP